MLIAVSLILASAPASVTDGGVEVSDGPRRATVAMPTRRPVYRDLDDVFEAVPRVHLAPVKLDRWSRSSATVPWSARAIVSTAGRPVDFENGEGPSEIHLKELDVDPHATHAFLQSTIALGEAVVVDLPWSRSLFTRTDWFTDSSGRVVNAGGGPVPGVEVHHAWLSSSGEPSGLVMLGTTGPDGKWERESDNGIICPIPLAPGQAPPTGIVAYRTHASHAWQVFPRVEGGTVFLAEPALLSVFVVDENGEPVEDSDLRLGPATVAAPGLLDLPGPVAPDPDVTLRELGGWEIPDLSRGVYRVYARAPGHAPAAASIDLSSGHRELMLTLPRAEPFAVSVMNADGTPAAGARVTVTAAGGDVPVDGATADALGKLVIDRAPAAGPLLLHAAHPRLGSAETTWESGPREVTLTLSGEPPPPRMAGTWGALHDRLFAE